MMSKLTELTLLSGISWWPEFPEVFRTYRNAYALATSRKDITVEELCDVLGMMEPQDNVSKMDMRLRIDHLITLGLLQLEDEE